MGVVVVDIGIVVDVVVLSGGFIVVLVVLVGLVVVVVPDGGGGTTGPPAKIPRSGKLPFNTDAVRFVSLLSRLRHVAYTDRKSTVGIMASLIRFGLVGPPGLRVGICPYRPPFTLPPRTMFTLA